MSNFKEIISKNAIATRVKELAEQLNADYADVDGCVTLVCVLKGASVFTADLMRHLNFDVQLEFIQLASYSSTESSGEIQVIKDISAEISGQNVLVIEDIIDTGNTLNFIDKHFLGKATPASLKYCVLLDNPTRRGESCKNPNYTGFVIPNQYVFGYGLDYDGKYRQLPYIAAFIK